MIGEKKKRRSNYVIIKISMAAYSFTLLANHVDYPIAKLSEIASLKEQNREKTMLYIEFLNVVMLISKL